MSRDLKEVKHLGELDVFMSRQNNEMTTWIFDFASCSSSHTQILVSLAALPKPELIIFC